MGQILAIIGGFQWSRAQRQKWKPKKQGSIGQSQSKPGMPVGLASSPRPGLCNPMDCTACQAPLSMGFFRQEYWSGLPLPLPGDFPDSWIEPMSPASPALQVDSLPLNHLGSPPHPKRHGQKVNEKTISTVNLI